MFNNDLYCSTYRIYLAIGIFKEITSDVFPFIFKSTSYFNLYFLPVGKSLPTGFDYTYCFNNQ